MKQAADALFYLAADRNYFPYACVAARRILQTSSAPLAGFILHNGVSGDDLGFARGYLPESVTFLDTRALVEALTVNASERITKSAYLRLFADVIPEFAPFSRAIYADCDVLFNGDIAQLATAPLGLPLLAAHDMPSYYDLGYRARLGMADDAPYFNSGVLILDLDAIRQGGHLRKARDFAAEHAERCLQHDQDALNAAFEGAWQTLHPLWNAMTNLHWMPPFGSTRARHFSGQKPWRARAYGVEKEALDIYRQLSAGTPWADRFPPYNPKTLSLTLKAAERRLNGLLAGVSGNPRGIRKARLDARLPEIFRLFGEQADHDLPAIAAPERLIGVT